MLELLMALAPIAGILAAVMMVSQLDSNPGWTCKRCRYHYSDRLGLERQWSRGRSEDVCAHCAGWTQPPYPQR